MKNRAWVCPRCGQTLRLYVNTNWTPKCSNKEAHPWRTYAMRPVKDLMPRSRLWILFKQLLADVWTGITRYLKRHRASPWEGESHPPEELMKLLRRLGNLSFTPRDLTKNVQDN